jgi:hypothetical protein
MRKATICLLVVVLVDGQLRTKRNDEKQEKLSANSGEGSPDWSDCANSSDHGFGS